MHEILGSSTSLKETGKGKGRFLEGGNLFLNGLEERSFFFSFFFFIKRQSKFATRASRNELIVPLISFISLINPCSPGPVDVKRDQLPIGQDSCGLEITFSFSLDLHLVQIVKFLFLVFNARINYL